MRKYFISNEFEGGILNNQSRLSRVLMLLVLGSVLTVSGCGRDRAPSRGEMVALGRAEIGTYNGDSVTVDELAKWFVLFGERTRVPDEDSNETQWVQQVLNSRVLERVLGEKARQLELDQTEFFKEYKRRLEGEGITRYFFQKEIIEPIQITSADINRYYRTNRSRFEIPTSFSFKVIFFDAEKDGRERARRRAQQVLDRLEQGAPFDSLIYEHSDLDVIERTKDFGPYTPDSGLLPPIKEAALKLNAGEVSGLIEHNKGFHIIRLTRKTESYMRSLEEVQEEIRQTLFDERLQLAEEQLVAAERENLNIQENYHILGLPITATNDVVLKVGSETMTFGDYQDFMQQGRFQSEEDFQAEFQKKFRNMVYLALGRLRGYGNTPEVQEWMQIHLDRELTFAYLESEVDSKIEVSEEELRRTYEEHPTFFFDPRMVYAAQIYIPIEARPEMARHELIREIQLSKARALQVIEEIKGGMSFEEAARLYSSAPNAERGGIMGWIPFGYSPRFDNAAFKLDEGEITTDPISQRRGYQIVKVIRKADSRKQTFEEARDAIRARLLRSKADETREEFVFEFIQDLNIRMDQKNAELFGKYLNDFWGKVSLYTIGQ